MNNTKIIIRFSSAHNPVSWAIRVRTWSRYSHVDFVLPGGLFLGAIPLKGVSIHTTRRPVEDYFELSVTPEQYRQIMDNAYSQMGKPYDYAGLFGFAVNRNWQDAFKWFCSEYIAGSINPVIKLFNELAYKISPRDLSIHHLLNKLTGAPEGYRL